MIQGGWVVTSLRSQTTLAIEVARVLEDAMADGAALVGCAVPPHVPGSIPDDSLVPRSRQS